MSSDPLNRLSASEIQLVDWINENLDKPTAKAHLAQLLQVAAEIELATIPIYLYTYYSVERTLRTGENILEVDLFANKAGANIMSVAVEEMLHMSLASNILFALTGKPPELYKKAPGSYPTTLPFHNPVGPAGPDGDTKVSIPLAKFSFEQMWHFLQIEYPEKRDAAPQDGGLFPGELDDTPEGWDTIGQVYAYIRCVLASKWIEDSDLTAGNQANQIQNYNYYPNNTDTVYVREKFDPWKPAPGEGAAPAPWASEPGCAHAAEFTNADDSHAGDAELVTVATVNDAMIAIDTICDQGEGYAQPVQDGDPGVPTQPTDDPSKTELSHYFKFLTLQAQLAGYANTTEVLPQEPKPPAAVTPTITPDMLGDIIIDFPDNPMTADYPAPIQAASDFLNGLFQYMLIMSETVYHVPPDGQKLFFNVGMHRSMIWIMDKYIKNMGRVKIEGGIHDGKMLAPTFENYDLGDRKTSMTSLRHLYDTLLPVATAQQAYYQDLIDQNPHDPQVDYWSSAKSAWGSMEWYAQTAVSTDPADNHLPDVAAYW